MEKLAFLAEENEVWRYAQARRFLDGDPFLAGHEMCVDGWPCDPQHGEVCQYSKSHFW